jgi:hypothetical protein
MSGPATEGSVQQRVHRMSVGHDERLVVERYNNIYKKVNPILLFNHISKILINVES